MRTVTDLKSGVTIIFVSTLSSELSDASIAWLLIHSKKSSFDGLVMIMEMIIMINNMPGFLLGVYLRFLFMEEYRIIFLQIQR